MYFDDMVETSPRSVKGSPRKPMKSESVTPKKMSSSSSSPLRRMPSGSSSSSSSAIQKDFPERRPKDTSSLLSCFSSSPKAVASVNHRLTRVERPVSHDTSSSLSSEDEEEPPSLIHLKLVSYFLSPYK